MSYNKLTIQNQAGDSDGNISLSLENLQDVTISSVQLNQALKYDGSEYINADITVDEMITGYFFACENSTVASVSSTYDTTSVNSKFVDVRLSAGYGREDTLGGLISVQEFPSGIASGANIYCQFQLASGQFELTASTRGHFSSSSGLSVMAWMDASYNQLGPQVEIRPPAGGMRGSKKIIGYINTNTTAKVHLGFVSTTGHYRRRSSNGYTVQIVRIGDYIS